MNKQKEEWIKHVLEDYKFLFEEGDFLQDVMEVMKVKPKTKTIVKIRYKRKEEEIVPFKPEFLLKLAEEYNFNIENFKLHPKKTHYLKIKDITFFKRLAHEVFVNGWNKKLVAKELNRDRTFFYHYLNLEKRKDYFKKHFKRSIGKNVKKN